MARDLHRGAARRRHRHPLRDGRRVQIHPSQRVQSLSMDHDHRALGLGHGPRRLAMAVRSTSGNHRPLRRRLLSRQVQSGRRLPARRRAAGDARKLGAVLHGTAGTPWWPRLPRHLHRGYRPCDLVPPCRLFALGNRRARPRPRHRSAAQPAIAGGPRNPGLALARPHLLPALSDAVSGAAVARQLADRHRCHS